MPTYAPDVDVIRSARRTRTSSARLVEGRIQVRIPAWFSEEQERETVEKLVAKVRKRTTPRRLSDAQLAERAERLNRTLLDGRACPGSIRWVSNQNSRWGSCTLSTGAIRISDRLQNVPDYVLDSVIVHELVHTFIRGGHSAEFWEWANRAPKAERARGYLEAYQEFSQGGGGQCDRARRAGKP